MDRQQKIYSALIASLLGNAFLLGIVLSSVVHPHPPGPMRPHLPHEAPFIHMKDALGQVSPQYRAQIQAMIDKNQKDMHGDMDHMHHDFDDLAKVLTAPHFDPAQLKAIHQELAKHDDTIKSNMETLMISIAQTLPDVDRIKFFERFCAERDPEHGGPGEPGGPPPGADGGPPPDEGGPGGDHVPPPQGQK